MVTECVSDNKIVKLTLHGQVNSPIENKREGRSKSQICDKYISIQPHLAQWTRQKRTDVQIAYAYFINIFILKHVCIFLKAN